LRAPLFVLSRTIQQQEDFMTRTISLFAVAEIGVAASVVAHAGVAIARNGAHRHAHPRRLP
jgi:hypothetical protein